MYVSRPLSSTLHLAEIPLAKDKETAPFALEYSANVDDDDNEFAYLKQDDMEMDVQEPEEEEEEPREVISHAQLREEMLQRARENVSTGLTCLARILLISAV